VNNLVSIIVPCYNQAQYLDECLESIFNQTYPNWECIIINDGSLDETEDIALSWCNKDTRFIYLKKENGGLSSARNAGLKKAKGEYIQFLDCDDTIHPLKFEKQTECFSDKIDISVSDYFPFDNRYGTFFSERYVTPFLYGIDAKYNIVLFWETQLSIPCHCVLFKRELLFLNDEIYFDETLPNHEDWVFWSKLFYRSKGFVNIKIALANYRIHFSSMCYDLEKMNKGFVAAVIKLEEFFKNENDFKGIQAARMKRSKIDESVNDFTDKKATYSLKKVIKLFLPPITFIIFSKITRLLINKK
jgi:glycosyltransferase involved in cell wall biosynthesis